MERALLQGERESEVVRLRQEQEAVQQLQEKLSSLDANIRKERDKVSPVIGSHCHQLCHTLPAQPVLQCLMLQLSPVDMFSRPWAPQRLWGAAPVVCIAERSVCLPGVGQTALLEESTALKCSGSILAALCCSGRETVV